jgi:malonyl-CoA O-methyltransferase
VNAGAAKQRIGGSFHRRAGDYDRHAVVQKRVVARLDELIAAHMSAAPARLLDIGCGTGSLLAALQGRYPQAALCGLDLAFNMAQRTASRFGRDALIVNADAEHIPFGDQTFDLVASASTLQWVPQLDLCFREFRRVLTRRGLICTAFFGERTLWELQESYREALKRSGMEERRTRLRRFLSSCEVVDKLHELGFRHLDVTSEMEVERHADVPELLRAIKGIGAATPAGSAAGGLGWRRVLNDMADIYRARFGDNGTIPATYEVIYVIAR